MEECFMFQWVPPHSSPTMGNPGANFGLVWETPLPPPHSSSSRENPAYESTTVNQSVS